MTIGLFKVKFYQKFLIFLFFTSCGLKYQPVQTPRDIIEKRQQAIIEQMKQDFSTRQLLCQAIKFGQSATIKPPSHYRLDSLYGRKYELEKKQLTDRRLDEQITLQKNIVYQDTTAIYYVEKYVFSVGNSDNVEVFLADVSTDKKNQILTIDILESNEIDKKLVNFYSSYALQESFIYPNTYADDSELAFYEFYKERLLQLEGKEQELFLNFMLRVMQIAQKGKNVDKTYLIKELVRNYAQGSTRNYIDERFNDMEEIFDERNVLTHYRVDYTYSIKDETGTYRQRRCQVLLDVFLQLMEIIPVEK